MPASTSDSPDIARIIEEIPLDGSGFVVAVGTGVGVADVGVPGRPSHAMPLRLGSRLSKLFDLLPPCVVKNCCASGWVLKSEQFLVAAAVVAGGAVVAVCAVALLAMPMANSPAAPVRTTI